MRIDYPEEAAAVGGEASPRAREIVDEVVKEEYGKIPTEMTGKERRSVTRLKFDGYSDLDDIAPLAGLTALQELYLQGTQVSDIALLAHLTELKTLDLHGTQVSDVDRLAGLAALQRLNLHGTQVSDVAPLEGLANLEILRLHTGQVSDEGIRRLSEALPDLEIGYVDANQ